MNTVVVPNAPPPIIGNKYRLGRILGAGGMGFVHEAEHMALGERVALKFLRPECSATPENVERFLREAKSLFKIKSDNVVRLLDVDAPADCAPYLVMEFLDGEPLGRVLDRHPRLEVCVATEIVRQVCSGLAEAHRIGIVHRDVKPQNVMLTTKSDGTVLVKLVDFGIAFGAANELTKRLTMTEAVIGTPSYMSPSSFARRVRPTNVATCSPSASCSTRRSPGTSRGTRIRPAT
ncbi:serine/threonine protein kinase [Labilithrix luteola]|uniref:Serine/threonine protein kinase n=1 Tax=Labilithrix luteola TaxID=1391654 RepID=A0A0K1PYL3_9BACT|nr:serine/threonine-protein kinase [Labilithrix luteola]AKU98219.1 serine/threonine protein kinase [Labilithrix luteola]